MKTLIKDIKALLTAGFEEAFPELKVEADVTKSTQDKFGHYQCNSAMRLAKPLKLAPRAISEKLISTLKEMDHTLVHLVKKYEIAGPGFINIWLDEDAVAQHCNRMYENQLSVVSDTPKEKVVVDFSSPNIAKEMHVGHLRSTIIGDSICRLFEYLGDDVLRLNHIGDWGTAFGMLIAYLKQEVGVDKINIESVSLTDLVGWYKASKQLFDHDVEFKKTSQLEVVKLQGGDQDNLNLWKLICQISEKAYREVYDLLDVTIIDRGESFYNDALPGIVSLLEEKGLVEVSEGAKCVYPEGFKNREGEPLPFMVQKSDGGFNYATTDLAALKQRVEQEKGTRLIYVTDGGQATHFSMLFEVAKQAGFYESEKVRCDHVPFGLVLGPDGKKFKTRSGETERLVDLLSTAISKAKQILVDRNKDQETPFNEDEVNHLAKIIGIGAVKYADLSCNRTNDYVFSYDRMLKFEGNTASFLLYSYVRICGIKRKIGDIKVDLNNVDIKLQEESELNLGLHICQWFETLDTFARELSPNRLCDYLFELAEKFNAFFRDCRVEGTQQQDQRLKLCELTGLVLAKGLNILGLQTTQRM